ncbi:ABC transporter ATP-binding protein [Rhizobium sp. LjRoot98]|uniref:ABC transporter ATP-binding protein n=1 Tax=Rhizobium sp. LjRoot98 TaxID=3342345 RepID=UPI003ED15FE8
MTAISIENLNKHFGAVHILKNISLKVEEGEFVALVGPSGCGKSTLLRIVAGLEKSTGGAIRIGARDVTNLPSMQRDIAMVFQSYALYPHMTVAENLGFCLRMQKRPTNEIAEKVREAARILHLEPLLDRQPRDLSGGQRQRVAMGRAIVRNPQVFLFDEPLSNLDAKLRVVMRAEIKEVQQRFKTTTVYVTHDQIEAMTMADRIVVMDKGEIVQAASPMEIYSRPKNIFVAGFIGSPQMNFVNVSVNDKGAASLSKSTNAAFAKSTALPRGDYVLGIRPENIALQQEDGVPAKVTLVEPTGAQTYIHTRTEGGEDLVAMVDAGVVVRSGEIVRVKPSTSNFHLFDVSSGERIEFPRAVA